MIISQEAVALFFSIGQLKVFLKTGRNELEYALQFDTHLLKCYNQAVQLGRLDSHPLTLVNTN